MQWSSLKEGHLIGVDEAGRGCLCGPVYAAAVSFNPKNLDSSQIYKDSKALKESQRDALYEDIYKNHWVGVGSASSIEVDRVNILQATFLAMKRAVDDLAKFYQKNQNEDQPSVFEGHIIVDGIHKIPQVMGFTQSTLIQGDKLVSEISAASIIAKVTRDRYLIDLDQKYPEYDFRKHKGYGTLLHRKKIEELGPCPEHRITFKGVREFLHLKQKQSYQGTVV